MIFRLLLLVGLVFAAVVRAEIVLQEKVARLGVPYQGPFVRDGDGAIWGVNEGGALVSRDEGKTWEPREIYDQKRYRSRPERALLRTKEGVLLYAFLNELTPWQWGSQSHRLIKYPKMYLLTPLQ
jgi:hypothetical protein